MDKSQCVHNTQCQKENYYCDTVVSFCQPCSLICDTKNSNDLTQCQNSCKEYYHKHVKTEDTLPTMSTTSPKNTPAPQAMGGAIQGQCPPYFNALMTSVIINILFLILLIIIFVIWLHKNRCQRYYRTKQCFCLEAGNNENCSVVQSNYSFPDENLLQKMSSVNSSPKHSVEVFQHEDSSVPGQYYQCRDLSREMSRTDGDGVQINSNRRHRHYSHNKRQNRDSNIQTDPNDPREVLNPLLKNSTATDTEAATNAIEEGKDKSSHSYENAKDITRSTKITPASGNDVSKQNKNSSIEINSDRNKNETETKRQNPTGRLENNNSENNPVSECNIVVPEPEPTFDINPDDNKEKVDKDVHTTTEPVRSSLKSDGFNKITRADSFQNKDRRKHIYEQLRKTPWVEGYYSEGQSIQVFVDLETTREDWALNKICEITGQTADKFHVKHSADIDD